MHTSLIILDLIIYKICIPFVLSYQILSTYENQVYGYYSDCVELPHARRPRFVIAFLPRSKKIHVFVLHSLYILLKQSNI